MNIQKSAMELFGNACYAYCIAYMKIKDDDFKTLTKMVVDAYSAGWIDDDGYVSKPHKYYGSRDVVKVYIDDLSDLPDGQLCIVEWKWNGKSHFVVCSRYKVVFDPWENSDTVKYGKPVSWRKFI